MGLFGMMKGHVEDLVSELGKEKAAVQLKKEVGKEVAGVIWKALYGEPLPAASTKPDKPAETTTGTTAGSGTPPPPPPPPPPAPPVSGAPVDEIDLTNATSLGKHKKEAPNKATISATMKSAKIEGHNVRIEYEGVNWPSKTGSNGKTTDGGVYIYWQDGAKVVGGFFDHHGKNQKVKTLENVPAGYLDGQKPPTGAAVYFGMVSYDGKQRTNFIKSQNNWP